MNKYIAFEPYTNSEMTYINSIQSMIQSKYDVISYNDVKNGYFALEDVGIIYLNWIEGYSDAFDKIVLKKAKLLGIKIIWVFHNKLPHDVINATKAVEWIKFYIDISDIICILSNDSKKILKEYCKNIDFNKIHYLPHQDFCNMYGDLGRLYLSDVKDDEAVVFGCLGLIRPYKNIELIIEAFNRFKYRENSKLLIAGKSVNDKYLNFLKNISCHKNINFIPSYIPSSMMGSYVKHCDVLVFPYNIKSSMNSSAMIMAFSYHRTVIVPKIEMTSEFPNSSIFLYDYCSEEDHINKITKQMEKAYEKGKKELHNLGDELCDYLLRNNAKDVVKDNLLELIDSLLDNQNRKDDYKIIHQIIKEREFWKEQKELQISKGRIEKDGISISKILLNAGVKKVAIYGYGGEGKRLYNELINSGIEVPFIIDQKNEEMNLNVPVYKCDDNIPYIEYIIVTSSLIDVHSFRERQLRKPCCILLKEVY